VQQVDATLVVRLVRGCVVDADPVVDAGTGSSDGGHHVIAGFEPAHVRPNLQHAPERLVPGHQEVVALRGVAVLGVVDLLVCPIHADAQHLHQNAASVGDVVDARLRKVGQVDAAGLARENGYCFHQELLLTTMLSFYSSIVANRLLRDSASVGWAKMVSRRTV
jgi:hypothetical protein